MFGMAWVHVKQAFHTLNTYNNILLLCQFLFYFEVVMWVFTTIRIVTKWLPSDMLPLIEAVDFSSRC